MSCNLLQLSSLFMFTEDHLGLLDMTMLSSYLYHLPGQPLAHASRGEDAREGPVPMVGEGSIFGISGAGRASPQD